MHGVADEQRGLESALPKHILRKTPFLIDFEAYIKARLILYLHILN